MWTIQCFNLAFLMRSELQIFRLDWGAAAMTWNLSLQLCFAMFRRIFGEVFRKGGDGIRDVVSACRELSGMHRVTSLKTVEHSGPFLLGGDHLMPTQLTGAGEGPIRVANEGNENARDILFAKLEQMRRRKEDESLSDSPKEEVVGRLAEHYSAVRP
jgi:hypothetical protein